MIRSLLLSLVKKRVSIYFIVGLANTVFAYILLVASYNILSAYLHTVIIGSAVAIINVALSFLSQKIFVFKTKGNWFLELAKCYLVNCFAVFVAVFLLWLLVDIFKFSIYLAQVAVTVALAVVSYIGHLHFTFRHQGTSQAKLQLRRRCDPPSE